MILNNVYVYGPFFASSDYILANQFDCCIVFEQKVLRYPQRALV